MYAGVLYAATKSLGMQMELGAVLGELADIGVLVNDMQVVEAGVHYPGAAVHGVVVEVTASVVL